MWHIPFTWIHIRAKLFLKTSCLPLTPVLIILFNFLRCLKECQDRCCLVLAVNVNVDHESFLCILLIQKQYRTQIEYSNIPNFAHIVPSVICWSKFDMTTSPRPRLHLYIRIESYISIKYHWTVNACASHVMQSLLEGPNNVESYINCLALFKVIKVTLFA